MKKAVLDTNIIISAMLSPHGNSAKILNMVFDRKIETYYCKGIWDEYIDILSRPRFNFTTKMQRYIV